SSPKREPRRDKFMLDDQVGKAHRLPSCGPSSSSASSKLLDFNAFVTSDSVEAWPRSLTSSPPLLSWYTLDRPADCNTRKASGSRFSEKLFLPLTLRYLKSSPSRFRGWSREESNSLPTWARCSLLSK